MATNPVATTGYVLAIGDGDSPELFVKIRGVGDIGGGGSEATVHDSSSHDTLGGWGTIVMGLKRQQPWTFPVMWQTAAPTHDFTDGSAATPEEAIGLGYLHEAVPAILKTFIGHPAGDPEHADRFYAYVTGLGQTIPVDGILMKNVTLTPTGAPEHIDASALTIGDDQ